jgi:cell division protein FtsB
MRINYRVLSVALLLSLSRAGLGQTAPTPTREDSLKGRIWTATARRVWTDEKATPPATTWATGTDFSKWVLTPRNDKDELGSLWKAVRDQVGKDQPATPAQLAKAILAEINKRKTTKTGALAKVNLQSLQVDLEPFVPAGSTASAVVEAADSATPAAAQSASTSHTVAEDENPAPEVRALPAAATYTSQPLEPRYFGMPAGLAGAVLTMLGALLGFGLARQLKGKRRSHRQHSSPPSPAEPENSSVMTSQEYRKIYNQNQQLHKEIAQLKQQIAGLQKQQPAAPAVASVPAPAAAAHISTTSLMAAAAAAQAAETPPPVTAAPPVAEEVSIEELVGAQPAAPQPAATRYGPVQETPFVEERKIVDSPLPQLALMLTVNPRNPDQASFTLNPNVDQARLIGDGLTRLQKFFDYDPPLGGRITLVTAAASGQLQRQADGWQVVQRARLNIS